MRDEIRRAFEAGTEAPHPALRSALRARLEAGPAGEHSRFWRITVAATLVAGIVALAFVAGINLLPRGNHVPGPAAAATPSPGVSSSPSPAPSPSSTASPTVVYTCAIANGGVAGGPNVTGVRVGTAGGYDRFVIQFDGPVPLYTVTPQDSSSFMEDGSGRIFQLQGSAGLRVVVHNGSAYSVAGTQTYTGPNDFKAGFPVLKEARNMGDYERVYTWGLGMSGPNCYRAYTLTGPDRLVIDIQSP